MSKQGTSKTLSKGEESHFSRLKSFLGLGAGKGPATHMHAHRSAQDLEKPIVFTAELLKEIGPKSPVNNRMRTIRELCEVVQTRRLEENAVEALWNCVSDLLAPGVGTEDRHLAFKFLTSLIKGQYRQLGIMRAHFFQVIKGHTLFEDLPQRLEMFKVLSSDGKDLKYFEENTGVFLLEWMKDIISSSKISDFLSLLVNVIKYNAAHLDENVVAALVLHTTLIANRTGREEDIELCLKVLDTVIAYSCLPTESLHQFTTCLCRIVNIEQFCQSSWMLMRKLLGTHLGHRGIYTMCCILQDKNNITDSGAILLRGAVFFVGMALWGSKKVSSLKHPPSAVLPSFIQALEHSQSSRVAYEVVLSVKRLVDKYGQDQQMITWDLILDIIDALLRHIEGAQAVTPLLISSTHDLLTVVEELYERGQFNGSHTRFFAIIETCANKRPEASILSLVQYKAQSVHPAREDWIQTLHHIVEKYFKQEMRPRIRWKVLDVLSNVISDNRQLYEDELIEVVVLPHLAQIEHDPDLEVRQRAAQLIVDLASSSHTLRGLDLLDLSRKVINRPFSTSTPASPIPASAIIHDLAPDTRRLDPRIDDVSTAVIGLISIFKAKLCHLPSSHPLRIYELLVKHVQAHYHDDHMMRHGGAIRKAIFELLLVLRADGLYRLGLPSSEGKLVYSPHIICAYSGPLPDMPAKNIPNHNQFAEARPELSDRHFISSEVASSPPPVVRSSPVVPQSRITIVPYAQAFTAISDCLESETDWTVLCVILEQLPLVLQNKTLILAALPEDIDRFCARLCAMVSNRNLGLPERFHNKPARFTKSDFHSYIFPVLTCLVSYHTYLDRSRQVDLLRCLEFGLVSKCAKDCVRALTVCALEMVDMMMRQLPLILLRLSQISATMAMAIPLMEFLSSLIRLPQLYTNFVEEQYMSVFAIALPYTNPFKYTHYTVSLAYHVIAMWFLKCKLPFRKRFVGFIVKGLRANVLRQFEESAQRSRGSNIDSSDRNRAQSLNDEALRKNPNPPEKAAQARAAAVAKAQGAGPAAEDDSMMQFHKELMETCIDMMARYTFSTCASMPRRTPFSEFLLDGGQSQSWLLGNKIITIATSGGAGVSKSGLCDKCLHLARAAAREKSEATRSASDQTLTSTRKRHKSAAVRSKSETVPLKQLSQVNKMAASDLDPGLNRPESPEQEICEILGSETVDDFDDLQLNRRSPRNSESNAGVVRSSELLRNTEEDATDRAELEGQSNSIGSMEEKMQMVDSVLMNLKPNPTDKSIFTKLQCNCWCTLWAEIHIRRPTGNVSWMMRIQNEQDLSTAFPDFPLADMSNLFLTPPDDSYQYMTRKKIDSMSLGETEYDHLLEEHFERDSLDDTQKEEEAEDGQVQNGIHQDTVVDVTTSEKTLSDAAMPIQESSSLRKSTSSPELTPQGEAPGVVPTSKPAKQGLEHSVGAKTKPAATEPTATEPTATEPTATEPTATEPAVTEPAVTEPAMTEPAATEPSQTQVPTTKARSTEALPTEAPQTEVPRKEPTGIIKAPTIDAQPAASAPRMMNGEKPSAPVVKIEERPKVHLPDMDRSIPINIPNKPGSPPPVSVSRIKLGQGTVWSSVEDVTDVAPRRARSSTTTNEHQRKRHATGPPAITGTPLMVRRPTLNTPAASPDTAASPAGGAGKDGTQGHVGMNPSFIFLQLYHSNLLGSGEQRPILLPAENQVVERGIKMLDLMFPYETHKIGVLYVGKGQESCQVAILSNEFGSSRYAEFLRGLGDLLRLADCSPESTYVGGLDLHGCDGQFAYAWHDDFMQVIYHVAILMPTNEKDPNCNAKKLHIGNDYVTIVYNESGADYKIGTIKGQFNYVNIIVQPLDHGSNAVVVQTRDDIVDIIGHTDTKIISDFHLSKLVRQMAVHANLASMILQRQKTNRCDPFASNWLERLRKIRHIRSRVETETSKGKDKEKDKDRSSPMSEDFTDFV